MAFSAAGPSPVWAAFFTAERTLSRLATQACRYSTWAIRCSSRASRRRWSASLMSLKPSTLLGPHWLLARRKHALAQSLDVDLHVTGIDLRRELLIEIGDDPFEDLLREELVGELVVGVLFEVG